MTNDEIRMTNSDFVILVSTFLRISGFVIRILPTSQKFSDFI